MIVMSFPATPTEWQQEILTKILSVPLAGIDELRQQMVEFKTKSLDEDGSFQIFPTGPKWTRQSSRVPIEGEVMDQDGTMIQVLLHVLDGYISEVEIYRVDGEKAPIEFPLARLVVRASDA